MNFKTIITAFFLLITATMWGQEKEKYVFSLQEAQEYAVANNKTLKIARSQAALSDKQVGEAISGGLPQVNGGLDYNTNFNYELDFNPGGGGTAPPDIDYTLLDAGDFEILSFLEQMTSSSEGGSIVLEDRLNASVQVSQLFFNGQYLTGIKLAKIARSISEKNINLTALDIKENVVDTYYLILITEEYLRIIDDNIGNLNEVFKHTSDMAYAGLAEQTDADQIQVSLSQVKNSKKAMDRNLQLNFNMLRFLLGLETNEEVVLTDKIDQLLPALEQQSLAIPNLDIEQNPSYQIMLDQELISEKNINFEKWAYGPTLTGFYSYTKKLMTSGFDLSPNNVAGVSLAVPIFSGLSRSSRVGQAKIQLDQTRLSKEQLEEQLKLQDRQLTYNLNSAYENYLTQKESVVVAKRVYQSVNNKYRQGMMSSLDLTQANTNYLQAENNYITSIMELLKSKLALDKLYNNL
ncbi:MAG TPA: TolC family protein [Bacteroidales bacterium]|nr:TolC family protein [Bacteroidales bacterium]